LALLIKLNDLRPQIDDIRREAEESLPGEDTGEVMNALDELSEILSRTIALIDKHYSDERTLDIIEKDLEARIDEDPVYQGIPEIKRTEIIEKIIAEDEMDLIGEEELKEYITEELKNSGTEELITKAYSKQDIMNLGESVVDNNASETRKYDAGLEILRGMVETPNGREDALTFGLKRLLEDSASRLHYIYLYYDLA
jgi:hypothetical protein